MQRQITQEETRELIQQIRNKIPDIAIRTTMLVGFPGELPVGAVDKLDPARPIGHPHQRRTAVGHDAKSFFGFAEPMLVPQALADIAQDGRAA